MLRSTVKEEVIGSRCKCTVKNYIYIMLRPWNANGTTHPPHYGLWSMVSGECKRDRGFTPPGTIHWHRFRLEQMENWIVSFNAISGAPWRIPFVSSLLDKPSVLPLHPFFSMLLFYHVFHVISLLFPVLHTRFVSIYPGEWKYTSK